MVHNTYRNKLNYITKMTYEKVEIKAQWEKVEIKVQ